MKLNGFVKNIGIYTLSNVLNAAIPFLLLPVLTRHLSPADYGILTNYNALINLLIPFIGINLMSSLQIIYVKKKQEVGSYISNGILVTVLMTLFFTGLSLLFRNQLSHATGIPVYFIYLTALYAAYNNIVEVLLALWRMEDKAIHYGIFRVGRTIVELSIALVLIIQYNYHFEGSILAISYSYGIGALLALLFLFRQKLLVFQVNRAHIQHLFAYGLPLIPHVLSGVAIMYTDKLMLSAMKNVEANGIFSVGFMVGQVIGMLQNSFNQAWVPWVYRILKSEDENGKRKIVRYTYWYILGILGFVFLLWLATPLIYKVIGKDFSSGMSLVLWIALGFAFNGMYKMVSVYFFYLEKTKQLAVLSFFVAFVNIGLNWFLIPELGYTGAALSTMTAMFLQFVLTWVWSVKYIQMPWFKF